MLEHYRHKWHLASIILIMILHIRCNQRWNPKATNFTTTSLSAASWWLFCHFMSPPPPPPPPPPPLLLDYDVMDGYQAQQLLKHRRPHHHHHRSCWIMMLWTDTKLTPPPPQLLLPRQMFSLMVCPAAFLIPWRIRIISINIYINSHNFHHLPPLNTMVVLVLQRGETQR